MTIINLPEVVFRTSLPRATVYRLEAEGLFPPRLKLATNKIGWIEEEIEAWLLSRPRAFSGLVLEDAETIRPVRVLTEKQIIAYTSFSRSAINRMIRDGTFPVPIKLSLRRIAYLKHEIDFWLNNRPRPSVECRL